MYPLIPSFNTPAANVSASIKLPVGMRRRHSITKRKASLIDLFIKKNVGSAMAYKCKVGLLNSKMDRKGGYLKYWNNDWKGKRAGTHDGTKECRCIVPTGNKVERE